MIGVVDDKKKTDVNETVKQVPSSDVVLDDSDNTFYDHSNGVLVFDGEKLVVWDWDDSDDSDDSDVDETTDDGDMSVEIVSDLSYDQTSDFEGEVEFLSNRFDQSEEWSISFAKAIHECLISVGYDSYTFIGDVVQDENDPSLFYVLMLDSRACIVRVENFNSDSPVVEYVSESTSVPTYGDLVE